MSVTNFKTQINGFTFKEMADIQDAVEQQYMLLMSGNTDKDALLLSNEAIAEALGVSLTDAAFQGSAQLTESVD